MSLTVKAVALQLGLSESLVYALCREGLLAHTRHGRPGRRGTIRISEAAVAAYVATCAPRQPAEGGLVYLK